MGIDHLLKKDVKFQRQVNEEWVDLFDHTDIETEYKGLISKNIFLPQSQSFILKPAPIKKIDKVLNFFSKELFLWYWFRRFRKLTERLGCNYVNK